MKKIILALALSVPCLCIAQSKQFRDWYLGMSDDGDPYIITLSNSGEALIKGCSMKTGLCVWMLGSKTPCTPGVVSPTLFNTPSGIAVHNVQCDKFMSGINLYRYKIYDPDDIDAIATTNTGVVGIAYGLDSGLFQANRFSMSGAADALSAMAALFQQTAAPRGKKSNTATVTF